MLTNPEAGAGRDEQAGERQSTPGQADPGARSAGDPSRVGSGGMGPTGVDEITRRVLALEEAVRELREWVVCGSPEL